MRKLFILFAVFIMAVLVVGCTSQNEDANSQTTQTQTQESDADASQTENVPNAPSTNDVSGATSGVSSDELKLHNSKSDCWVSFEGKVYDITLYLPEHPGSAGAISPYCGTSSQFENAFSGQHGASKVKVLLEKGTFKGNLAN